MCVLACLIYPQDNKYNLIEIKNIESFFWIFTKVIPVDLGYFSIHVFNCMPVMHDVRRKFKLHEIISLS